MTRTINDNRRIGARIAAEREARGWDHADLSVAIGFTPSVIERVEKGAWLSEALIASAAKAFGLSVEALTSGEASK